MFRIPEDFSHHPTYRWLPAFAWLVVFTLYAGMSMYLGGTASRRTDAAWPSWLGVIALAGVAVLSLVVTARAWKDARAVDDQTAIFPTTLVTGLAPDADPTRSHRAATVAERSATVEAEGPADQAETGEAWPVTAPLAGAASPTVIQSPDEGARAEAQSRRLADMLDALEVAGILEPGEVPFDLALEAASQFRDQPDLGLDELLDILEAVEVERGARYRHLVLYPTQLEVTDRQIAEFVEDATRLAGRLGDLGAIRLEAVEEETILEEPRDDDSPAPEQAVVHFDLDGQWQSVPFLMFEQGFPIALIEGLAGVLADDGKGRVFVEAWSGSLVAIAAMDGGRLAGLDAALAWDGETFSLVEARVLPVGEAEPRGA